MPSRRAFLTSTVATALATTAGCLAAPRVDDSQCRESFRLADATDGSIGGRLDTDTAGDGIPDVVVNAHGLDPERKHAFVRVDLAPGVACPETLSYARSVFADAPIENPDGSTGIDVHFLVGDRDDLADTEERSAVTLPRLYHWNTEDTRGFDRRHRGYRHLVIDDDVDVDGWSSNHLVRVVEPDMRAGLVAVLAAEFAGWYSSLVETDGRETDALGLPWGLNEFDVSTDELYERVDWKLVGRNLAATVPSTQWYERKYAYAALDGEAESPTTTVPEDPEPFQDTSGDGIPDAALLHDDTFDGASPLRRNVFVEVDYHQDVSREVVETQLETVERVFADAPLRNPDGSMGLDFHYVIEDEIDSLESFSASNLRQYANANFRRHGRGYNYILFVPRLTNVRRGGVADNRHRLAMMIPNASVLLHELGHLLGLSARHDGVDDREFTFEEYPSVMNYNLVDNSLRFAGNDGHPDAPNDWAIIEQEQSRYAPDVSALD